MNPITGCGDEEMNFQVVEMFSILRVMMVSQMFTHVKTHQTCILNIIYASFLKHSTVRKDSKATLFGTLNTVLYRANHMTSIKVELATEYGQSNQRPTVKHR